MHCGLVWWFGIPTILQRSLTVPLNSPNGRQMPAVRPVQDDRERVSHTTNKQHREWLMTSMESLINIHRCHCALSGTTRVQRLNGAGVIDRTMYAFHYTMRWSYTVVYFLCLLIIDSVDVLFRRCFTWWRHQMETFAALLALCGWNSPVTGEFLTQRPMTRSFDVFFDLCLNKRLSKQPWGCWFETPSLPLWRHCN